MSLSEKLTASQISLMKKPDVVGESLLDNIYWEQKFVFRCSHHNFQINDIWMLKRILQEYGGHVEPIDLNHYMYSRRSMRSW